MTLSGQPSLSPDDDVFVHLAKTYSNNHQKMHLEAKCSNTPGFPGGITNGASWYPVLGGMQDYNYAFHGCMELTLEISCCKYPKAQNLSSLWQENRKALVEFALQANLGVAGVVFDAGNLSPLKADLKISGREMPFYSRKENGEFFRILLPGNYSLEVEAEGYHKEVVKFSVGNPAPYPRLTFLKIPLVDASVPRFGNSSKFGNSSRFVPEDVGGPSEETTTSSAGGDEARGVSRILNVEGARNTSSFGNGTNFDLNMGVGYKNSSSTLRRDDADGHSIQGEPKIGFSKSEGTKIIKIDFMGVVFVLSTFLLSIKFS